MNKNINEKNYVYNSVACSLRNKYSCLSPGVPEKSCVTFVYHNCEYMSNGELKCYKENYKNIKPYNKNFYYKIK